MASLSGSIVTASFLSRKQPPSPAALSSRNFISNFRPEHFRLKSSGNIGRFRCMASYKVKLVTPEGPAEFECPDDVYVLDKAEEEGIELPYSCRSGSCCSCAGKIVSGTVDQSDGNFLDDEQIANGYVLTCVAYPTSDVVIETHKEADVS